MSSAHPRTALLLIDPYNDFLHPNGKLYNTLADSLKESNTIQNIKTLLPAIRSQKIPVYYCLHQQHKPGFLDGWKHATVMQEGQKENAVFEEGSWGVEFFEGLEPSKGNGDVVVSKHWSSR
jgi:nicotinamidase-related amidase